MNFIVRQNFNKFTIDSPFRSTQDSGFNSSTANTQDSLADIDQAKISTMAFTPVEQTIRDLLEDGKVIRSFWDLRQEVYKTYQIFVRIYQSSFFRICSH